MEEFIEAMEGFLKASNETYANWPHKKKMSTNWTECYKLFKIGWQVKDYIEVENSDDMIVRWSKNNEIKDVRLTFSDQCIWMEFLDKQENKNE